MTSYTNLNKSLSREFKRLNFTNTVLRHWYTTKERRRWKNESASMVHRILECRHGL